MGDVLSGLRVFACYVGWFGRDASSGLLVFVVLRGGLWGMSRAVFLFLMLGWSVLEGFSFRKEPSRLWKVY